MTHVNSQSHHLCRHQGRRVPSYVPVRAASLCVLALSPAQGAGLAAAGQRRLAAARQGQRSARSKRSNRSVGRTVVNLPHHPTRMRRAPRAPYPLAGHCASHWDSRARMAPEVVLGRRRAPYWAHEAAESSRRSPLGQPARHVEHPGLPCVRHEIASPPLMASDGL